MKFKETKRKKLRTRQKKQVKEVGTTENFTNVSMPKVATTCPSYHHSNYELKISSCQQTVIQSSISELRNSLSFKLHIPPNLQQNKVANKWTKTLP